MVRLAAKGAVGLVLAVVVLTAALLQGHRAWARDHSFLVIYPLGWKQSFPAVATDDATPLLRLSGPTSADGLQAHVVVDHAPATLPEHLDQLVANVDGPVRCDAAIRLIRVGGADALLTDCNTSDTKLEVVYITRDLQHYVAVLTGAAGRFDGLRSDFQSMLDSWAWQ